MGVPSYFGWIIKRLKKHGSAHTREVVTGELPNNLPIHRLYFDFNCLIHGAKHVEVNNDVSISTAIIARVIEMTRTIIALVQPTDLIYIAIDGSVPMGKCKQQRFRRFKAMQEARDLHLIAQNYQHPVSSNGFDSNAISPGTQFMQELSESLQQAFQFDSRLVIIDDSLNPGEGERKIMKHLQKDHLISVDQRVVIYGLDADLIFLSLGLHHPAIYLIRENTFRQTVNSEIPEYMFVNIPNLAHHIVAVITESEPIYWKLAKTELSRLPIDSYESSRIIDDYIVISFLLGNDFVQRLYCLEIKNQGCEIILEIYRYCLRQTQNYLVERSNDNNNRVKLNIDFLRLFFEQLLPVEQEFFANPPKFFQYASQRDATPYETAVQAYQSVPEFLYRLTVRYPTEIENDYYHSLFHSTDYYLSTYESPTKAKETTLNIKIILKEYWKSLIWTAHYYLTECLDYHYVYPFNYAPLVINLSETVHYLDKKKVKASFHQQSQPLDPLHQLMIILPPSSYHLLPRPYHQLLKLQTMQPYFPKYFSLSYYGNTHLHQCAPRIPILSAKLSLKYYLYLKNVHESELAASSDNDYQSNSKNNSYSNK